MGSTGVAPPIGPIRPPRICCPLFLPPGACVGPFRRWSSWLLRGCRSQLVRPLSPVCLRRCGCRTSLVGFAMAVGVGGHDTCVRSGCAVSVRVGGWPLLLRACGPTLTEPSHAQSNSPNEREEKQEDTEERRTRCVHRFYSPSSFLMVVPLGLVCGVGLIVSCVSSEARRFLARKPRAGPVAIRSSGLPRSGGVC